VQWRRAHAGFPLLNNGNWQIELARQLFNSQPGLIPDARECRHFGSLAGLLPQSKHENKP
jgi:hypothetical protein